MSDVRLVKESVLRVGKVSSVSGRSVSVDVDKEKNLSELFFDGNVLRNVAVGSYVEIKKGFLSLIGKVNGEASKGLKDHSEWQDDPLEGGRTLHVSLVGYIGVDKVFFGGTKELPLVGNEAFLLTKDKVDIIHSLVPGGVEGLNIARSDYEGYEITLPIDGLINSHVAIFGNTGSGKSNTLAAIYGEFVKVMRRKNNDAFEQNCKLVIFDFNGEYVGQNCISDNKTVYNLSTYNDRGDKIPLGQGGAIDIEIISILADATEKTQKPFLSRSLSLMKRTQASARAIDYIKSILRRNVKRTLQMSDKVKADLALDYFRQILPNDEDSGFPDIGHDIDWNNVHREFMLGGTYLKSNPNHIQNSALYQRVDNFSFEEDFLSNYIVFSYIQLIEDILSNRAQNEHVAPAINKLKSKQKSIHRVFDLFSEEDLFPNNVVVVSLNDVNIEMKKTIPLLLSRTIYQNHKRGLLGRTLNIIIDEAHNILSKESYREAESWKDYRLETFEEIIKEGRKFGVFVTVSSQRPSDISPTITSQAHNYFIHRLINQKDLQSIGAAVSYIDAVTEESIPSLPVGTCIFSGLACQMPLKLSVNPLQKEIQPASNTLSFSEILGG